MTKLIALIVEDDQFFALPAWHRAITLMERRGLLVTHVAVVPQSTVPYGGILRSLWYSSVFGVRNTLRMAMFSALERKRRQQEPRTWNEMAHAHGLVVKHIEDPNSPEMKEFLRSSRCEILHTMGSVLLSPEVLDIPRMGVIAHHPSLLPSCRGVFPYLRARLNGQPVGQSFQKLSAHEPMSGPLVAQCEASPRATRSMLAFHVWMARRYPELALDATQRFLAGRSLPVRDGIEASYGGLPTRRDRERLEECGGRISLWADLRLTVSQRDKVAALEPVEPPVTGDTAYQFPDVLPLSVNESGGVMGKVIPMQRRRRPATALEA